MLSIPFYEAQSVVGHAFLHLENCWAKAFTPELYITGHCLETINSGAEYCTVWRKETYLEFSIVSECN
jgi:hypothetical protein